MFRNHTKSMVLPPQKFPKNPKIHLPRTIQFTWFFLRKNTETPETQKRHAERHARTDFFRNHVFGQKRQPRHLGRNRLDRQLRQRRQTVGYIANDVTVIIATKDDNKWLAKFRDGLNEDFMPLLVGPIDHAVNGLYTWVLTPNGSKDRWDTKRTGQRVQDRLEARCRKHNTDYVTVRFGGDYRYEIGATITGGSHLTSHTN